MQGEGCLECSMLLSVHVVGSGYELGALPFSMLDEFNVLGV
jgi:hypothetical protein